MSTTERITTAEQLLEAPGLGRCELVRGELVMMTPGGFEHGCIVADVGAILRDFVKQRGLGRVTGAETGFQIARQPDTVRAPDVAFIRAERLPEKLPRGYFQGAPDLAVEVLSPSDLASEVLAKVQAWLDAGCRAVWVVEPKTHTVHVYRSAASAILLKLGDTLTGGDLLPGLRVPIAEFFASSTG